MRLPTPVAAVTRGVTAGVLGTALMMAWQELAAKLKSSPGDGGSEPQEPSDDPWEDAWPRVERAAASRRSDCRSGHAVRAREAGHLAVAAR
jgi:hypothetical protein